MRHDCPVCFLAVAEPLLLAPFGQTMGADFGEVFRSESLKLVRSYILLHVVTATAGTAALWWFVPADLSVALAERITAAVVGGYAEIMAIPLQ